MRRWLVALALAVVVMPEVAGADQLRVDLGVRKVMASSGLVIPRSALRTSETLPSGVELELDRVTIRVGSRALRHTIGDLAWAVAVGKHLVIGHAVAAGGVADRIVAIDHTTGQVAWRRKVDSMLATRLADDLLAVERAGTLDVLDARTGRTLGTTPLAGQGIQAIVRSGRAVHLKTGADLVAIDRASGRVQWTRASTSRGNIATTPGAVVDAWVDRTAHRFGIVTYDPASGAELERVDLGSTGGWYDVENVELSLDDAGEVLVSSMFAVA